MRRCSGIEFSRREWYVIFKRMPNDVTLNWFLEHWNLVRRHPYSLAPTGVIIDIHTDVPSAT